MLCTFGMPWCLRSCWTLVAPLIGRFFVKEIFIQHDLWLGGPGKTPKDVLLVWAWVCCYGCLGLQEVESGIAVALNALKPAPHHALWSPFTDFPWSLLGTVSVVLNWTSRSRDASGERLIILAANWCKKLPLDGAFGENADMSLQHLNKPLFGN